MTPRRFAVAAVGATLAFLLAPLVAAHAELKSSDPPAGANLAEAPDLVSVTLTEPVDRAGASLYVTDSNGARVDSGAIFLTGGDQPVIQVQLKPQLPSGPYTMRWRVLSQTDGHLVEGTVGFAIGD